MTSTRDAPDAPPAAPSRADDLGLRLSGVSARPGGADVLRRVDLDVPVGTTTSLLGPSGAGKTTLLRVVAGLEPAHAGRVTVDGHDLTDVPAHRRGVGVVFQEPRLFPDRSVRDNVAFGLEVAGVAARERHRRAEVLLDRVGLGDRGDRSVTGLSGGEQQRVNLARALAVEPRVLLLDEPLAAVDPDRRADLRALLVDLTADVTAVHVTHDPAEAAELGDAVAVLVDGELVQHAPPRDVFERPASAAVARLVGAGNVLDATVVDGRLVLLGGSVPVDGPDGHAVVVVRPERVVVGAGPLTAAVAATRYLGDHLRVDLVGDDGTTLAARVALDAPPPPVGTTVAVDLPHVHRLPGATA